MNTICTLKFTKGLNYVKTVDGATLPYSAHRLMTLNICTKFQNNISRGFRVIERTQFA